MMAGPPDTQGASIPKVDDLCIRVTDSCPRFDRQGVLFQASCRATHVGIQRLKALHRDRLARGRVVGT